MRPKGWLDRWRKVGAAKPRVAVLGLDGVGTPLVEALTDAGVMPRLAALRRAGTLGRMTSSLPTVSSVSWASVVTGVNPGRHGIGFYVKGALGRTEHFGRSALTGMHTYGDALFYVNRPGFPTADLAITDLAPTVLAMLGCPPVVPMDGRALAGV